MKKLLFALSMVLPLAMMSNANAQRPNHTKKDVSTQISETYDKAVDSTKEAMHNTKEDMSRQIDKMNKKPSPEKWLNHQNKEIDEDYSKAVKKINKSTFNQDTKNLLMKQAAENKDLAMKQAKERSDMMKKHWDARKNMDGFKKSMHDEGANRKAVKEVRDIID